MRKRVALEDAKPLQLLPPSPPCVSVPTARAMTTTEMAKHWLSKARGGSAKNGGHTLESRLAVIDLNVHKLVVNRTEFVELIARTRSVLEALDKTPTQQIPDNQDGDLAELMVDLVDQVSSLCKFIKRFTQLPFMFRLARNQALLDRIEQMHSDLSRFIDGAIMILEPLEDERNNELIATLRALAQQETWVVVVANEDIARVRQELQKTTTGVDKEMVREALDALRFEIPRLARLGTTNRLVEVVNEHLQRTTANVNTVDEDHLPRHIPDDEIALKGKPIGAGGCGEVFRAKLRSNIWVIVKRVISKPPSLRCQQDADVCACAGHTKARDLLLIRQEAQVREMQIWCQLNHPHILRLYGATSYGPNGSIVSEDACHGSLDVFAKTHQDRIWQLLYEAALGIHHMHWKGFVHGDLACDNIFIGGDWKAKIADFGLSFPVGAAYKSIPQSEKSGVYAPEFFGKTPSQSLSADVFAFGMCIVEAYSGAPPWKLAHPRMVQRHLIAGNLPDVFQKLPLSVQELVTMMCAFDPAARPTIADVVVELKKLVDDPPPPYVIVPEYEEHD